MLTVTMELLLNIHEVALHGLRGRVDGGTRGSVWLISSFRRNCRGKHSWLTAFRCHIWIHLSQTTTSQGWNTVRVQRQVISAQHGITLSAFSQGLPFDVVETHSEFYCCQNLFLLYPPSFSLHFHRRQTGIIYWRHSRLIPLFPPSFLHKISPNNFLHV